MDNPEKVYLFLRERTPQPVCDDCISKHTGVGPRQQVNPITRTLALTTDFDRQDRGTCSLCDQTKQVTRSLRRA
jgi:hypothetical protein